MGINSSILPCYTEAQLVLSIYSLNYNHLISPLVLVWFCSRKVCACSQIGAAGSFCSSVVLFSCWSVLVGIFVQRNSDSFKYVISDKKTSNGLIIRKNYDITHKCSTYIILFILTLKKKTLLREEIQMKQTQSTRVQNVLHIHLMFCFHHIFKQLQQLKATN